MMIERKNAKLDKVRNLALGVRSTSNGVHMTRPVARNWAFLPWIAFLAACQGKAADLPPGPELQINLASYHNPPKGADRIGWAYNLPSDATLRYFAAKGFRTIKLPMNWNRLQPRVNGPLAEDKLRELDDFLVRADRAGFRVIVNLCAFGGRDGHQLGSKELPTDRLANFWAQFARRYAGRLAGYDIMNEPHDMPSPHAWPEAAQKAVDAIRKVDRKTEILVEGDDWSNAGRWMSSNRNLDIQDPAHRLTYSAHIYFDKDTSGYYKNRLAQDGVDADTASERLRPFVSWLRLHKFKGHIGEFGVPGDEKGWLGILQRFLEDSGRNGDVLTGITYWAGGDWTDSWNLTVQPATDGKWTDRPQMAVLTEYQAQHQRK